MAWQAVNCPQCGREVSYLFSLESKPGQHVCAECIREARGYPAPKAALPYKRRRRPGGPEGSAA